MVQPAPVATEVPQSSVAAKSPLARMVSIVTAPPVTFVTLTVCGSLVVPTAWSAKVKLAGFSVKGVGEILAIKASFRGTPDVGSGLQLASVPQSVSKAPTVVGKSVERVDPVR